MSKRVRGRQTLFPLFYCEILGLIMARCIVVAVLSAEKLLAEPLESNRLYMSRHIWISNSCHGTLDRTAVRALAVTCTWTHELTS